MKRKHFLTIASIVALLFGLSAMLMPDNMTNSLSQGVNGTVNMMMQEIGVSMFIMAIALFIARNDAGSPALTGLLAGNLVMHLLLLIFDGYYFQKGFINSQGVMMSAIVHGLFVIGFGWYLWKALPAGRKAEAGA